MRNDIHEFSGAGYAKASAHQTAWGEELASLLSLSGDEKVLDLGCGDGRLTRHLAALVPEGSVLGIDASAGMLEEASRHAGPNCHFAQLDMRDLSFDSEFDAVFSNAAMHWVADQRDLVVRIFRSLRPGGVFLAEFGAEGNCPAFLHAVRSVMEEDVYKDAFRDFTWPWNMPDAGTFAKELAEAGFSGADVAVRELETVFPGDGALIAWIDQPSIVPFLEHLPPDLKEPFRDAVTERTVAAVRQPDGTCVELFRRLRVRARKENSSC